MEESEIAELFSTEPVHNIVYRHVDQLLANDYNPNIVFDQELKLLEFSLLKTGWIQPVLISNENIIIDGFHRYYLSKTSKGLIDKYHGYLPCAILAQNEAERMMMTIRINRAKGSHIAVSMSKIIRSLHDEYNISLKEIGENIGAIPGEIELLYKADIFKKLDIQKHKYSKAWYPNKENISKDETKNEGKEEK